MFIHIFLWASCLFASAISSSNNTKQMIPCSHCKHELCQVTDHRCIVGCKDGFYGPHCNFKCHDGCLHNKCITSGYGPGRCTEGCIDRRWGHACQLFCPLHCKKCKRNNATECTLCKDFYYGSGCGQSCHERCPETGCNQAGICKLKQTTTSSPDCGSGYSDKRCVAGCAKGLHGSKCHSRCSHTCRCSPESEAVGNCVGECSQADGSCKYGCRDGSYGIRCQHQCSPGCTDHRCDRTSGHCLSGCHDGNFGADCARKCSNRCKDGVCDKETGRCSNGCFQGHYDDFCLSVCDTCLRDTCNSVTGECLYGCKSGYFGTNCLKSCDPKCETGMCYRTTGTCVNRDNVKDFEIAQKNDASKFGLLHLISVCAGIGLLVFITSILLALRFCKPTCVNPKGKSPHKLKTTGRNQLLSLPEPHYLITTQEYDAINDYVTEDPSKCLRESVTTEVPCKVTAREEHTEMMVLGPYPGVRDAPVESRGNTPPFPEDEEGYLMIVG